MSFLVPAAGAKGALNSPSALPVVPEEVTPAWFTSVLGRPVAAADLVEAIHGTASKLLYKLTYANPADAASLPTDVCVKGGFNPALVKLHPSLNAVYRREAEFFYHIAPTVPRMRLPVAWYSGSDTVTGQGIVVLDNLTAQGHSFGTPLEAWPVERVRAGVEELAMLHAKTWGAKQEDFPWLVEEGPQSVVLSIVLSLMTEANWAARFLDEAARPPVPDHFLDRERMIRAFKTLLGTKKTEHVCLVHGDAHIGNTLITSAGEPGFVDWQGLHFNSFLHDVTYFMVGALTIEDRRANEVELFEYYLDKLHEEGGPRLDRAAVWTEYRKHHFHGIAWAMTPPMMQPKDRVDTMTERYVAAILDHESIELLESLPGYVTEA